MNSKRQLTILFIPLEPVGVGFVHRGASMIRMLRQRDRIIGLERSTNFGTSNKPLQYLRLLRYWLANFRLGFRHRQEIDLIVCEHIHGVAGGLLAKLIKRPCLWDIEGEDRLHLKAWGRSRLYTRIVLALDALSWGLCRRMLVPCEEDRQGYISRGRSPERVTVVPLCIDISALRNSPNEEKQNLRRRLGLDSTKTVLLYTGNRNERPYRFAAEWICQKLTPALAERHGDKFVVLLTGRGPTPSIHLAQVVFTGFVDNFVEYLAAADICLCPIWLETGMPGKIVEYIAAGKATVITSLVRGFPHLRDGVNALVAATEEEFIHKTSFLIEHPSQGELLGARARETAIEHYSLQRWSPQTLDIAEDVAGSFQSRQNTGRAS